MENKVVLVSGAGGNLGQAVVREFLAQSQKVAGLVRKKEQAVENPGYLIVEANLLNENESAEAVSAAILEFGKIDTAVLTAGGFAMGTIASTTVSELEKYYKLNFETAYNLAKPLLQHMKENGKGKIFFIGSGVGLDTSKGSKSVAYTLSKSLLFQLVNIINAEMGETGIQAHVVIPGTIDTPQNRAAMPKADFSKWTEPKEIARVICRFSQAENSIENTVIVVEDELKVN